MGMKPGAKWGLGARADYLTEEVKRTPELLRPRDAVL